MKKRNIRETSGERAFSREEITMFKVLNKEKENLGSKEKMIDFIKTMLRAVGFDPSDALRLYYLYTVNYRPDAKYQDIMRGDEKSLFGLRPERTSNLNAGIFAKSKIPFKGSNLEGFWEKDPNGKLQYIITSYNWYPIYIYKDNTWFEVTNSYSRSTSKQMRNLSMWGTRVVYLTPNLMNKLRRGMDDQKIKEDKLDEVFEFLKTNYQDHNYVFLTAYQNLMHYGYPSNGIRFKFRVNNLEKNEKIDIGLDVLEVAFKDGQNRIITRQRPENIPGFEEIMTRELIRKIIGSLPTHLMQVADEKSNWDVNFIQ